MKNKTLALLAVVLCSCGLDRYNNNSDMSKIENTRKNDSYIYSEGDSARQSKLSYTEDKDAAKRTNAIREKLYGDKETKDSSQIK